jgi:phenylalanyl-tRNA synthetase alpha chain
MRRQHLDPWAPALPGRPGRRHPVTAVMEESVRHFAALGFEPRRSRQLEDARHSFDLLGVPDGHPTRAPARTFYTSDGGLLRTHTTASVLRVLADTTGPARFTVFGACHRNTVTSARSVHQFHQVEAVAVGPAVGVTDLSGLALGYVTHILGAAARPRLRFRSLPYVAPGIAVDVSCTACAARGCGLCRGVGHIEVVSGGLLTGAVLRSVGTPADMRAVAVAVSLERVLAVRHGLDDIRHFLRSDPRFLTQIG